MIGHRPALGMGVGQLDDGLLHLFSSDLSFAFRH